MPERTRRAPRKWASSHFESRQQRDGARSRCWCGRAWRSQGGRGVSGLFVSNVPMVSRTNARTLSSRAGAIAANCIVSANSNSLTLRPARYLSGLSAIVLMISMIVFNINCVDTLAAMYRAVAVSSSSAIGFSNQVAANAEGFGLPKIRATERRAEVSGSVNSADARARPRLGNG